MDSANTLNDFTDLGLGYVTNYEFDNGKFRSVTLRNIELTAPYMHDGRFQTLDEVIEHYNSGGHPSPNIDANMKFVGEGLNLSESDKEDLKAFLMMLTDTSFINNPEFSNPF